MVRLCEASLQLRPGSEGVARAIQDLLTVIVIAL